MKDNIIALFTLICSLTLSLRHFCKRFIIWHSIQLRYSSVNRSPREQSWNCSSLCVFVFIGVLPSDGTVVSQSSQCTLRNSQ